jgi:hypothetical protein
LLVTGDSDTVVMAIQTVVLILLSLIRFKKIYWSCLFARCKLGLADNGRWKISEAIGWRGKFAKMQVYRSETASGDESRKLQ